MLVDEREPTNQRAEAEASSTTLAVLVNECYQLLCPTCVTPSVRPSRNSCSRQKPTSCHETQPQISLCHETQEGGPSTCHETQGGSSTCHETQEGPSTCHETQGGSRTGHETQGGGKGVRCQSRASDHTGYTPFACTRGASARSQEKNPFLPFELSPFHFSLISIVIISVPYQNWKLKVSHVADSFRFQMLGV